MSHRGIRCGIPAAQVVARRPARADVEVVSLWPERDAESPGEEHLFELTTPDGARLIRGEGVRVIQLLPDAIRPISPFLRHFMTLPHVVGLSDIDGELVWLVDAKRLRTPSPSLRASFSR